MASQLPTATHQVFSPAAHAHLIPYLAALHGSCITHDQMAGSFLPPLNHEKLLAWWKDEIAEANAGTRVIVLLLDGLPAPGDRPKGSDQVGTVMLRLHPEQTSPHFAFVESLLVSPRYRGRGGARYLITAVEAVALRLGMTLLVSPTPFFSATSLPEDGHGQNRPPGAALLRKLSLLPRTL